MCAGLLDLGLQQALGHVLCTPADWLLVRWLVAHLACMLACPTRPHASMSLVRHCTTGHLHNRPPTQQATYTKATYTTGCVRLEHMHAPTACATHPPLHCSQQASLAEVRHRVGPLLEEVRSGQLATSDGLSYLEAKHLLLLNYCISITFYLMMKAEGRSVKDHPVISRLVQVRAGGPAALQRTCSAPVLTCSAAAAQHVWA
jgi:hypothetical protein